MPDAPGTAPRRPLQTVVKLLVSLGLLYFVLRGIDMGALWAQLKSAHTGWLFLALAVYGAMVFVSVWRWQLLLRAQDVDVPTSMLAHSFWVALFFNNFLPSNIGGDVIRIADTAPHTGSRTLATTVIIVDRILGLFALFLVATIGVWAASAFGVSVPGAGWLTIATVVAAVVGGPLYAVPGLLGRLLGPLRAVGHPWILERAELFEEAFVRFRARPHSMVAAFGGALVVQLTLVVFYALTARSLAIPLPLVLAGVLIPISLVIQMAPISING
jgi:uncharacterized membrane protein YbhN (UPF0104 family)